MSKIILCGASSVGKTTLARDWCSRYARYTHITEVARDVMKERGITLEDLTASRETPEQELYLKLQGMILEEQNKRETELGDHPFISDRGADPLVYAHLVNKELAMEMSKSQTAEECFTRYRESLVVLVCPLKSTDDKPRFAQWREQQNKYTSRMKALLVKFRIPYMWLGERNRELRIEILEKAVQGVVPISVIWEWEKHLQCVNNREDLFKDRLCLSFYLDRNTDMKTPYGQCAEARIRTFHINPSEILLCYPAMDNLQTNRVIACNGEDYFISIRFHLKLPIPLIMHILNQGVQVNGEVYQFLGCSYSGLNSRECYMLKGSVNEVEQLLTQYGEFSKIKMELHQLKAISQLLSVGIDSGVELGDMLVEDDGGDIIDGCGRIGIKLAEQLAVGADAKVGSPEDNIPSVFQIMFLGYKCVVLKDPTVDKESLHVRKSVERFERGTRAFQNIWVCGHSRPYSYGHLTKEYIMLLSALGVPDEVFLRKQEDFFIGLQKMKNDRELVEIMLKWQNQPQIAASCKSPEEFKLDKVQLPLNCMRNDLILKMEKLNILLPNSRMLFGVCDPLNLLKQGECFIRISNNGLLETIQPGTHVIVGRSLCYRLGDVHVLTAVEHEGLNHLVDCVVLNRPHSTEIDGSDPAGEKYFVCWDKDLMPLGIDKPRHYQFVENPHSTDVTRDMLMCCFSEQENLMEQISKHFQFWADINSPKCTECEKLAALIYLSETKPVQIPRDLVSPKGAITNKNRVWNRMQKVARERRSQLIIEVTEDALSDHVPIQTISEEFIQALINDEKRVLSEYKLFKLICKWCTSAHAISESERLAKLCAYSDKINFSEFTLVERREAVELGVPIERVFSAFHKSRILTRDILLPLYLTSPVNGWKLYLRASSGEFNWNILLQALTSFPESLLVLQLPDDIKLAFHLRGPLKEGNFVKIPTGSLSTRISSPNIPYKLRHVTESEYNLQLSEDIVQFFKNDEKCDTFICLKRLHVDKKERSKKFDIVSIDLNRFKGGIPKDEKKINKRIFCTAEIFVKISSQTNDVVTPDLISHDKIEDVPSDGENAIGDEVLDTDPIRILSPDAGLKDLKEFAKNGDCLQFSRIISSSNDEVLQLIQSHKISQEVLVLLSNIVVNSSHRNPSVDIAGYLKSILESTYVKFRSPKDLLLLYTNLEKLHLNEVTLQHLDQGLNTISLESISQYYECIFHWEWWVFLPLSVSSKLSSKLYLQYSLQVPNKSEQQQDTTDSVPTLNTIQDLARLSDKPPSPIDEAQLDLYKCYFAHLTLNHLLAECSAADMYRETMDTEFSVCMLKAALPKDSPANSELVGSSEDEEESINGEKTQHFQVIFSRIDKISSNKFVVGSYVKIGLMPTPQSEHSNEPIALGRIRSGDNQIISVDIHEPLPSCIKRSAQLRTGHWSLTTVGNVTSFNRSFRALHRLPHSPAISPILVSTEAFPVVHNEQLTMDSNTELLNEEILEQRTEVLIESPPIEKDNCSACELRIRFNLSQENAISSALKHRLTLIHGYAGTGKTVVASEIAHRLCHLNEQNGVHENCKILVTAATDRAVDNLTREMLSLNLFVLRVGNMSQVCTDLHEHSLEYQVEMKRTQLGDQLNKIQSSNLKREIIRSADIIATTCTGAGDKDLREIAFSFIIIDEATGVIEPISLIPIVKSCEKLVLIGDPNQLSPTLANSRDDSEGISSFDALRVSLFHRLHSRVRPIFLEEQHRMHPYISQFPSRVFYSAKMRSGVTVAQHERPPPEFNFIYTNKPAVFIHVDSSEAIIGTSITNPTEADVVVDVVKALMSLGILSLKDIAVLTLGSGQVECLKEKLGSVVNVDVCSIDEFQGRERNVIVFSTVRGNNERVLGPIGDPYIINKLLTRAKLVLIGVGNGDTLSSSHIWDKWLERHDVLHEDKFYRIIGEAANNCNRNQYSRNEHNYSASSSYRESESGSVQSSYSDSELSFDGNIPSEFNEGSTGTGRRYSRESDLDSNPNV